MPYTGVTHLRSCCMPEVAEAAAAAGVVVEAEAAHRMLTVRRLCRRTNRSSVTAYKAHRFS